MIALSEISKEVQSYNPKADLAFLQKAYEFAEKVHRGQKRFSGDPYVIHPLEVAQILSVMKLDVASITAGLLHDTVEDTTASLDEIKHDFGMEVATLVDGVTKLGKIKFASAEEKQAENFRKMIMAMAQDIRVILIKLADRLNNMRTLQHLPEERRLKIAKETLDIYAPLANRLGIQWMKIELEDLSFKFLKPDVYHEIDRKMVKVKSEVEAYIDRVVQVLAPKLTEYGIHHDIYGRLKHHFSIFRKMQDQSLTFDQVVNLLEG